MRRISGLRRVRRSGRAIPTGTALLLALVLALAAPAAARKFQMNGTWLVRQGQAFLPLQFGVSATPPSAPLMSMGLFTEAAFSRPDRVVSAVGGASATGASPAALKLAKHRFVRSHATAIPLSGVKLIQVTTMLAIDAPYETATLRAGSGPGSFTWCPANPARTAAGPVPGPGTQRGRIVYAAGASQFGGTMRLGLSGRGLVSVPLLPGPAGVAHIPFAESGSMLRALAVGAGANDSPHTEVRSLAPGVVTDPTMFPPPGSLILHPGSIVAVLPTVGMGAGEILTERGFPHTTGTVLVQQTQYARDTFFAVMGSDARTPLGAGNIALVAGGLTRRTTVSGSSRFGSFHRVSMSLGAPVPSLSPAGAAAAAAPCLLAVGYARRRRARAQWAS